MERKKVFDESGTQPSAVRLVPAPPPSAAAAQDQYVINVSSGVTGRPTGTTLASPTPAMNFGGEAKVALARHLSAIGYELNASEAEILQKLRARMGERKFQRVVGSALSEEEIYAGVDDLIEGNLLRSLDRGVTLEASCQLYQQCVAYLTPGTRVTELGCWTGGLASFIAARHAHCSVVGVDAAPNVIDACAAYYRQPNLNFKRWNYHWAKPADLEPADVLLCSLGVAHHPPDNTNLPDVSAIRRSSEYVRQNQQATGFFSVWRAAAKDGALLFAVLRLRLFPRFLAWIDAAQATGWAPLLDRLWHVDLPDTGVAMPGLVFQAISSNPLREDDIIECWTSFTARHHLYARVQGGAAIATFRAMGSKTVLAHREFRRNGVLIQDLVGLIGETGWVFTHDAASNYRLLLVSRTRARELAAGVSVNGSSTPILDEGIFESAAATHREAAGLLNTAVFSGSLIAQTSQIGAGDVGGPK